MRKAMDDKTPGTIREPRDMGNASLNYNCGRETTAAAAGQKVITDYPLDRSSVVTSREAERGPELAGGPDDLSHSLRGVSTNNNGASARGRADTFKTPTKIKY